MPKKKKVLWHKRRGKFLPSAALKSHKGKPAEKASPASNPANQQARRKAFWKNLSEQIKKAARGN